MKCFHCDHCGHLVFFENFKCVKCDRVLAYLPDIADVASLEKVDDVLWRARAPGADGRKYRLCENDSKYNVCNWAVGEHDPNPLCISCRLTRVIPDLSQHSNKVSWFRLEAAKRRLIFSLIGLRLPLATKSENPENGLAFEFKADPPPGTANAIPVLTGHDNGVITVNLVEADDLEREKRKSQFREPYRTILGHFRHEIGHYYWDRLIAKSPRLEQYRKLFGDESVDYNQALIQYYAKGAPSEWRDHFISAYATAHAWEDWAETWAHYLHMADTLEIAADTGLAMKPRRHNEPVLATDKLPPSELTKSFDRMIDNWYPLTYLLNALNRGLGLPDGYPFVLSHSVVEKLRFVHDTIEIHRATASPSVAVSPITSVAPVATAATVL